MQAVNLPSLALAYNSNNLLKQNKQQGVRFQLDSKHSVVQHRLVSIQ